MHDRAAKEARAAHRRELRGLALNALSTLFGTGMSLFAKISGGCIRFCRAEACGLEGSPGCMHAAAGGLAGARTRSLPAQGLQRAASRQLPTPRTSGLMRRQPGHRRV